MMFDIQTAKDQGELRDQYEDAYLGVVLREVNEIAAVCAIADGLGGLQAGERASRIAIQRIEDWIHHDVHLSIDYDQEIEKLFHEIHSAIQEEAFSNHIQMGTTLTLIIIEKNQYHLYHVGDCRVYQRHQKLVQLSVDDTLAYRKWKLQEISEKEYHLSDEKHILLQCLGTRKNFAIAKSKGNCTKGDCFFLCTDGLHNCIKAREITRALRADKETLEKLIHLARLRGETDNITCMKIELCDDQG